MPDKNMPDTKIKAVGLLSGGLDSILAAKLMLEQGIEVYAINFTSPFCTCTPKNQGCAAAVTAVRNLGNIPLKRVAMKDEYLEMVRNPRHGYGRGMNPCIDCRIMKIKKAGEYMKEINASFLFTGEVLGQRPMSQHKKAMEIIDRESGFQKYIVRPLSAAYFEPTVPEEKGWIDKDKLPKISGRSRKMQMALAVEKSIKDYPCPAGGCLLTDKNFAEKMADYFKYTSQPSVKDIPLLKVGRHFRLDSRDKVIVARNEEEGKQLTNLCKKEDHLFTPRSFPGPVVILQGNSIKAAIDKMMRYTTKDVPENASISHLHMGKAEKLILDETIEERPDCELL
jgi:tRNA-specific 2-thiouridylase